MMENNYIKKDIQTLDQYSIMLCDDTLINHFGCHSTPRKDALFPLKVNDSECLLLPAPEFSALLYRGQNEYFEVCKPTLSRKMTAPEKLKAILQKIEFLSALKTHPLTKIFQTKYFLEIYPDIPNYKLKIDYEAIAQHYEFKTNHLDFSRDKEVAMFFMTCSYDPKNKKFTPISDDSKGVMYSYDFKLGILQNIHSINPIGFQPFSRPDKQKAFSIVFNKNINFNNFDFVKKEEIQLTKGLCEKYYDMFDGGAKLFPKDEISELSYEIQNSNYISKDAIEFYSQASQTTKKVIVKLLQQNSISITDNKYSFNISDMEKFNQNLQNIINDLEARISPRGIA